MKNFLLANPGISSRIGITVYFDSYDCEHMVNIVHKLAELDSLVGLKSAKAEVQNRINHIRVVQSARQIGTNRTFTTGSTDATTAAAA